MSELANRSLRDWEDFASQMRSIHYTHTCGVLGSGDQIACADVLTLWAMLVTDLIRLHVFQGETLLEIDRHEKNLLHSLVECLEIHPIDEFLDTLKSIDESILTVSFRSCGDYSLSFKQIMGNLPKGFKWLGNFLKWGIPWEDPIQGLSFTHQIASFPLRLNLTIPSLADKALADWTEVQSTRPRHLGYRGLRSTIAPWLSRVDVTDLHPRHGPGVALDCGTFRTTRIKAEKYRSTRYTPAMQYVDRKFYGHSLMHPFGINVCQEDASMLQFVPKSYSKYRSIAVEPSGKMWYQQAGLRVLDQLFRSDLYLRRRIRLRDASHNMSLAKEGSIDRSFATIDLSSASDCVTWELVKECSRGTPLYPLILASRTRSVITPTGEEHELQSFATMGSALCFPIECLVFAGIVETCILDRGHDPRRSRYSVYGDDIVVETRYAQDVLSALSRYGFKPNLDKTFTDSSPLTFRESCGGEYVNGVDVTPLRVSRFFTGLPLKVGSATSEQYAELVDLANRSFDRFPTVRRFCLKYLLALPAALRPLFSSEDASFRDPRSKRKSESDGTIRSHTATNFHLMEDKRSSKRLQRRVLVHGVVGADPSFHSVLDEPIRLYDWLANCHRQAEDVYLGPLPRRATVAKPGEPTLRRKAE